MKSIVVNAASLLLACFALSGVPVAAAQTEPSADLASQATSPAPVAEAYVYGLPSITVQITPPPISVSSFMSGISGPLGARPVAGKPISAQIVTQHRETLGGKRISRSTSSAIYRDARGRIRRESQLSIPGLPAGIAAATFITIVDYHQGYGWVLEPQAKIAHRYELNGASLAYVARLTVQGSSGRLLRAGENAATAGSVLPKASGRLQWRTHVFATHRLYPPLDSDASLGAPTPAASDVRRSAENRAEEKEAGFSSSPVLRIDQPFLAAPNPVRTENLGEEMILGFRAHGTRVITTVPAGQAGNHHTIDIVSEQWFSPELDLVMRSMHRDPWGGEFTSTVTRINRGKQPATLFEIPRSYRVVDSANESEHRYLDTRSEHAPRYAGGGSPGNSAGSR